MSGLIGLLVWLVVWWAPAVWSWVLYRRATLETAEAWEAKQFAGSVLDGFSARLRSYEARLQAHMDRRVAGGEPVPNDLACLACEVVRLRQATEDGIAPPCCGNVNRHRAGLPMWAQRALNGAETSSGIGQPYRARRIWPTYQYRPVDEDRTEV